MTSTSLQVLPTEPEPNRHKNLPHVLGGGETVRRMEKVELRALSLLYHIREDDRGSGAQQSLDRKV
jgi:hypothetical protein